MRHLPRRSARLAAVLAVLALAPASAEAAVITVETTADSVADNGDCSLPEALTAANTNTVQPPPGIYSPGDCNAGQGGATRDTIRFQIPGSASPSDPKTITIAGTALPAVAEKVVIDATTQPGYQDSPVVELRDTTASAGVLVLGAGSDGSAVRGLAISDAAGSGIRIDGSGSNVVAGNYLGLRPDGTAGSVAGAGATVIDAPSNTIGGKEEADRNVIAANGLDGVTIEGFASTANSVIGNSIRANGPGPGDLPIDLKVTGPSGFPFAGDGVSPNDSDDSDPGPNGAQNFPEITAAIASLSLIQGELESTPGTGFRIEVFASSATGPGGTGIARRLLGGVVTVTDASGHSDWGVIAAPGAFAAGEWITATATAQAANSTLLGTSEVSTPTEADTCTIEGTPAGDALTGTSGNDTICGFGGNDVIDGGGGDDFVLGGEGDDTLRGGAGHDVLFGGDGIDIADFSQVTSNVNASLADGSADRDGQGGEDTLSGLEALVGGPVADILGGDNLANAIDGSGGDDVINAHGGDDTVSGGLGDDAMNGGEGNDRELGGAGLDIISGGNGNDFLSGGTENDSIDGAAGNDTLLGEDGNDSLAGLEGEDLMLGALGNDRLEGGGAPDRLAGGPGTDRIDGDRGNDKMAGQGGNDTMNGAQGKDLVTGGVGNDGLFGGPSPDRMRGGKGKDLVNGGGGTDKLFGDDDRDRLVGGSGKNLCDGGGGRDNPKTPGCVTVRNIP